MWPPNEPAREVFCGIDSEQETVDEASAALRETFGPGGRDELTGDPIRALFADASVEAFESHGLPGFRASLTDARGTDPGELFGAFDRGSVMTYMGFQRPPGPD